MKLDNDHTCSEGEPDDELGTLTNELMNKLNEEETKLKQKSSLEIGTWSNDMAKESLNQVSCSL